VQRPDPEKRDAIMRIAARMFAEKPYHEVRLEQIATAARIGKGTIYVYFGGKEDLYATLIAEGIDRLIAEIGAAAGDRSAWRVLERAVVAMLGFAERFPHVYTLMRAGAPSPSSPLAKKRVELARALAHIVRQGVRSGELVDPQPALTAELVLAAVRGAMLFAPARLGRAAIAAHVLRVLGHGVRARDGGLAGSGAGAAHGAHGRPRAGKGRR
jgi:AcrR family transcriptional regulator